MESSHLSLSVSTSFLCHMWARRMERISGLTFLPCTTDLGRFPYSQSSLKGSWIWFSSSGKKEIPMEKPVTPAEPVEPVLCGSMAIGALSLAVARTSAVLHSEPLYLNIASLKHTVRFSPAPYPGLRAPQYSPATVLSAGSPCFRNYRASSPCLCWWFLCSAVGSLHLGSWI